MTDWEKLKVTDLKEELKSRGVALTGLKLKQQFIDKLNELDSQSKNTEDKEIENAPLAKYADPQSLGAEALNEKLDQRDNGNTEISSKDTVTEERLDRLPEDLPTELVQEESRAEDGKTPPPMSTEVTQEEPAIQKDNPFILQGADKKSQDNRTITEETHGATISSITSPKQENGVKTNPDLGCEHLSKQELLDLKEETVGSTQQSSEVYEDQRKRKRRSLTHTSEIEDLASKRAKTNDGTAVVTKGEADALEDMKEANASVQATLSENRLRSLSEVKQDKEMADVQESPSQQTPTQSSGKEKSPTPSGLEAPTSRSTSPPEREISPATHPATSSLYIRNFKRPLHIPTLRSHILVCAKSAEPEPFKLFYLDNIRTHAFISFKSISSASRVRNAMHGTRFPDEPMREPLWVDFIPDEKVQAWIDEETDGGSGRFGGGRGSSKKYEVVYNENGNGEVDAVLQEASNRNASQIQRSDFSRSYSGRASASQDPTASGAVASAIHPSRAALVATTSSTHPDAQLFSKSISRSSSRKDHSVAESNSGNGFGALDELFSSTMTKPKLYFKLLPQSVIKERQDMIRELRVSHDQMGRSGDEGMKRYSFESDVRNGKQKWVDKGPEFGFGRRGQERLTGFGSSYNSGTGGGRGRSSFRGNRRGGDSWRGR